MQQHTSNVLEKCNYYFCLSTTIGLFEVHDQWAQSSRDNGVQPLFFGLLFFSCHLSLVNTSRSAERLGQDALHVAVKTPTVQASKWKNVDSPDSFILDGQSHYFFIIQLFQFIMTQSATVLCCYTAEHWGLTQNHLQLQALCKTSVFPLQSLAMTSFRNGSRKMWMFHLQICISVSLLKNL